MTFLDMLPLAIGLTWLALIVGFVWRTNRSRRLPLPQTSETHREAGDAEPRLTPAEFHRDVVPKLHAAWAHACFCANEGFKRLTSFDSGSAAALADAQIVIEEIIAKNFTPDGPLEDLNWGQVQRYVCPKCGSKCSVIWEQFSINMDRSYVVWNSPPSPFTETPYLLGFYGFAPPNKVRGFVRVSSADQFVAELAAIGRPTTA